MQRNFDKDALCSGASQIAKNHRQGEVCSKFIYNQIPSNPQKINILTLLSNQTRNKFTQKLFFCSGKFFI
jgi:hypothetical protein